MNVMQNKAREQVRDELNRASRIGGYAFLGLGFLYGIVSAVAPLFVVDVATPWYLSLVFFAIGIPLAFPRSAIGHAIIGRMDLLLDRFVGKAAEAVDAAGDQMADRARDAVDAVADNVVDRVTGGADDEEDEQ